jgi:hypothetical protein
MLHGVARVSDTHSGCHHHLRLRQGPAASGLACLQHPDQRRDLGAQLCGFDLQVSKSKQNNSARVLVPESAMEIAMSCRKDSNYCRRTLTAVHHSLASPTDGSAPPAPPLLYQVHSPALREGPAEVL